MEAPSSRFSWTLVLKGLVVVLAILLPGGSLLLLGLAMRRAPGGLGRFRSWGSPFAVRPETPAPGRAPGEMAA